MNRPFKVHTITESKKTYHIKKASGKNTMWFFFLTKNYINEGEKLKITYDNPEDMYLDMLTDVENF